MKVTELNRSVGADDALRETPLGGPQNTATPAAKSNVANKSFVLKRSGIEGQSLVYRRVGSALEGIDDVFANPNLLKGRNPSEIQGILGKTPGWQVETLNRGAHAGQGMMLREYTSTGAKTGRIIQWHPGGGHHGPNPYWKVASGSGVFRIF